MKAAWRGVNSWCSVVGRRASQFVMLWVLGAQLALADTSTTNAVDLTALPIEDLMKFEVPKVYAASKVEQKSTQAPASITVVTSDDIKRYGYQTLADVLESVPGFSVTYDRNYDYLGVRGLSLGDFNSRILLLVDGHRVNNNLTDGAFVDHAFLLDVDLIDRVEIIHGPSAVLYGNNAFFGVINVVTRTGRQLNGFESAASYGSFDAYKARVSYGKQFTNGLELLLSGTYFNSSGNSSLFYPEFDTPGQNYGVAHNLDWEEAYKFFGSLTYGDLMLESAYSHRDKANPTGQYGVTYDDSRLRTTDDQGYAAVKLDHQFPEDFDLTARVYIDTYLHEIGYPFVPLFFQERDTGDWWGTEVQMNKRLWDRHTFTVGTEFRDDFHQQTELTGQPAVFRNRQSYGFYAQADLAIITNQLHLDGGVRYDKYGDFNPTVNPRVAVIYNPVEKSTFKAIYGSAFRAPNFTELSDPRFQSILPEDITSYELVYEQDYGSHLRSSLSGYYNKLKNLIVFASGNYTNLNAQTRGIEAALEGQWSYGIRCRTSYSLQYTTDDASNWDLPDSPEHLIKLNASVPLVPDKLFAGLEFQYTSSRRSLTTITSSSGEPITVQGTAVGGFGVLNFTLFSQHLIKNLEASASIYNLLDRHYADPATPFHLQQTIAQDGRTFRLELTYHF